MRNVFKQYISCLRQKYLKLIVCLVDKLPRVTNTDTFLTESSSKVQKYKSLFLEFFEPIVALKKVLIVTLGGGGRARDDFLLSWKALDIKTSNINSPNCFVIFEGCQRYGDTFQFIVLPLGKFFRING